MALRVEDPNVVLASACFDQWFAWFELHQGSHSISDEQLLREAYIAGWSRSRKAQVEGWGDEHEPRELGMDAAISRVVSRKRG